MKLPKELTTVTAVSKTLALSMFIIFPVCAFFIGMHYQQTIDMTEMQQTNNIPYSITPLPAAPSTRDGTVSCQVTSDCPANYSCVQAGPLQVNPNTHRVMTNKTCWKDGDAIPL